MRFHSMPKTAKYQPLPQGYKVCDMCGLYIHKIGYETCFNCLKKTDSDKYNKYARNFRASIDTSYKSEGHIAGAD